MSQLEVDVARITADLDSQTERDFGTPYAYDSWKFRATRALHHRRKEQYFLTRWLADAENSAARAAKVRAAELVGDELSEMVEKFLATAAPYTSVYSIEKQPASFAEAETRRTLICEIKLEYSDFLTSLRERSLAIKAPFGKFQTARGKISRVIQRIERELVALNKFSKDMRQNMAKNGSLTDLPESTFASAPNGDPRLAFIVPRLQQVKARLGMNSAKMTIWLYELVNEQRPNLKLRPEQLVMLNTIGEYAELTKQRLSIEIN